MRIAYGIRLLQTLGVTNMSDDDIATQIVAALQATDRLKRKHAPFWNSAKKSSKEMGVFTEVMYRISLDLPNAIDGWNLAEKDPPDIELTCGPDKLALEITELVNPKAICAQISGSPSYSMELVQYGLAEAKARLQKIVSEKEAKILRALPQYTAAALLIHTDEPMLSSDMFEGYLLESKSTVYDWIYLLFSYEPAKGECPLVRLQ